MYGDSWLTVKDLPWLGRRRPCGPNVTRLLNLGERVRPAPEPHSGAPGAIEEDGIQALLSDADTCLVAGSVE
jgi:hypothetical protein